MIPKKFNLNDAISLRVFGQDNDPDIVYNATPVDEFIRFQANSISGDAATTWIIDSDISIIIGWFNTQFNSTPIPPETLIAITVYTSDAIPIYNLTFPFHELTLLGSTGFLPFPYGTILLKGWKISVFIDAQSNGFTIIGKKCHVNTAIQGIYTQTT